MSDITNINEGTAKLASEDLLPVVFCGWVSHWLGGRGWSKRFVDVTRNIDTGLAVGAQITTLLDTEDWGLTD